MSLIKKILRRLDNHDAIYDSDYYQTDVAGPAIQAAPFIIQGLVDHFSIKSLIDVGCGTGAMLNEARARNIAVCGLEYSSAGISLCRTLGLPVIKFDIENDALPGNFGIADAVLSLEVAEHLPEKSADRYVDLLCGLGPIVACSAAHPGQDGTDHVNLQPQFYWIDRFATRGFSHDSGATKQISEYWEANGVAGFYHENLMIFRKSAA